jgi:uncharacterized damage-inducible protein DinB
MITLLSQFSLFADYNRLMNQRQYAACAQLSDSERDAERGAFFGSISGTLNHLLVGDILWLQRFATHPSSSVALAEVSELARPESLGAMLFQDFAELRQQREWLDQVFIDWIDNLDDVALQDDIRYRNMAGKEFCKPYAYLINTLFLHQVHHRGQITTLLSQAGIDFGDTDLVEIIPETA